MKTIPSAVRQSSFVIRVVVFLAGLVVVQGISIANRSNGHGKPKDVASPHGSLTKSHVSSGPGPHLLGSYGSLPLSFEPNEGQTDPSVNFVSHGPGYTVFLTANEAVVSQQEPDLEKANRLLEKMDARSRKRFEARRFYQASPRFHRRQKTQTIRVAFEGANRSPNIVSLNQLPGKADYFIGRNRQQWHAGIPTYARVKYSAIYPGIDLIYYGRQ